MDSRGATSTGWTRLLRKVILPAGDRVLGQRMMRHLQFLEDAQWWPRQRVLDHQDERLRELVEVAYAEVPFYRQIMDEAGVRPEHVRRRADLHRLPIVTKELVRSSCERTTRDTGAKTWESCSSGSTGQNFCVPQDLDTAGRLRACTTLGFSWGGWQLGAPHLQTGITPDRGVVKSLKDHLLRCHYISAYDLTQARLDEALDILQGRRLRHVRGYPGSIYMIALRALATGRTSEMDSIITWGDTLYSHYRSAIEEAFSTRVTDTYGCAEGIQVCGQCGHEGNYHIYSTDTIVESVDESLQPVAAGTAGHLLLTRLHPGPMPLIRYRVGDMAALAGDEQCPCGRGFEVLRKIQGRDTDLVLTPSGNTLIVHFFTGVLEHFSEIEHFQVVQEELESILVRVVPTSEYDDATAGRIRQALADKGADLRIDVETVDEIPLPPSAKRRFVISMIAPRPSRPGPSTP